MPVGPHPTASAQSAPGQLTLNFEPGLLEMHPTAMDCLRSSIYAGGRPLKAWAADMDMGESALSRKLRQDPDDPRRFSVDDLEAYLDKGGSTQVLHYLCAKYLQTDAARHSQALAHVESLLAQLGPLVNGLKAAAAQR